MKLYFETLKNKKVDVLYYIYKSKEDAKNDDVDPLYIFSDKSKADRAKENGYYVDVVTDKDALSLYEEKTPTGLSMPDEFELDPKGTPGFWTNQIRSLIHSMEKDNALKDFPYLLNSQLSRYPNVRKAIVETLMYQLSKDDIQNIMNKFKKYL